MEKTFFVTRHKGALDWAAQKGINAQIVTHLSDDVLAQVREGDTVIGILPIHLIAEVCARGARFCHLQVNIPAELRGQELTAEQLNRLGAELIEFSAQRKGAVL